MKLKLESTTLWDFPTQNYGNIKHGDNKYNGVTPYEDGTLTIKDPAKKGRAIVEVDTDGSYVLIETKIEEINKVKNV